LVNFAIQHVDLILLLVNLGLPLLKHLLLLRLLVVCRFLVFAVGGFRSGGIFARARGRCAGFVCGFGGGSRFAAGRRRAGVGRFRRRLSDDRDFVVRWKIVVVVLLHGRSLVALLFASLAGYVAQRCVLRDGDRGQRCQEN
jgi:hypothetical protein